MRSFYEICKSIGYDFAGGVDDAPKLKTYWVGYKNGEVSKFESKKDALKFSKNVEQITDQESLKEYDAYWEARKQKEREAASIWESELRKEYVELSDAVYKRCYSEAYDRGHSYGYDSVASHMDDYVDFALDIIKATK
jgi:hypothetical protein